MPFVRFAHVLIEFASQIPENRGRVPRFSDSERENVSVWERSDVRVLRREALSEHILSAKPWFRDRLVEVRAYRALVVLLDDADDNGAVLLRGFVYDLMLRMIALERLLVMLDFFAHQPRRDAVRKVVLEHEVKRLTDACRLDSLHMFSPPAVNPEIVSEKHEL